MTARGGLKLKPFFCTAYPMTIMNGVLMLDDNDYRSEPACCGSSKRGRLTVFQTCEMELRFTSPGLPASAPSPDRDAACRARPRPR
jgi:hypothetical protein